MKQRVHVRVVGFSPVERHALNTLFRLSQDPQSSRPWGYEPWMADTPPAYALALIDGTHPDASETWADITDAVGLIWVGSISPAKAWRSFQRPLQWPVVLSAMDEYMQNRQDAEGDAGTDTWPSVLESTGAHMFTEPTKKRILLADANDASRMYLRSKLASMGMMQLDEAKDSLQAKSLLEAGLNAAAYDAVIVDLDLPGGGAWGLLASAPEARLRLAIQERLSLSHRLQAKIQGVEAMGKPLDPSRLNQLLGQI